MARNSGSIEVICGSMFSGKTEELLRRVRRAQIAGQCVQLFKPRLDDRYDKEQVVTHYGQASASAEIADGSQDLCRKLRPAMSVIAIDEVQFFDDKIVDVCLYLAREGKRVIVSGLDQDYRGDPFEPMPRLMALAEQVDKLRAICIVCGAPATRTQRLIDGKPARNDDPLILVGGVESYQARCRRCHRVTGKRMRKPYAFLK